VADRRGTRRRRDRCPSLAGVQAQLPSAAVLPRLFTNRVVGTVDLEADHRRHAVVEFAIRELKYGVGLNYPALRAFRGQRGGLGLNVIAHNIGPLDYPHRHARHHRA